MKINENYKNVKESYLFADIAKRVNAFSQQNGSEGIIRLGIGDVTLPLAEAVVTAMKNAAEEMGKKESFRGYGPEQGYDFLREKIAAYYLKRNVSLDMDEIFISDGAKSDLGNITDLFDKDNVVLIPDPVYPVYVDTNIMNGRKIEFMDANAENGFCPMPPKKHADIIYLCSPNNPTGAVYNELQLKEWVDYAIGNNAVILFDAAYERFISEENIPHSIYEIEGAKECAIEFCSLSKTAGFTGTRCGYTVVPKALGELNRMWNRRQTTKFNGVPYIVQKGAEAVFTEDGMRQIDENINYYRKNAKIIADTMRELGINFAGGVNSPYIWLECPDKMDSWSFFDYLLNNIKIVGTPGAGFGMNGEGYFRLTAFGGRENTIEAMKRLKRLMKGE